MTNDLLLFFAFITILSVIVYLDRKKMKRQGIIFLRQTKKGRNFIDRTARLSKGFWNAFFFVGIIVGILAVVAGFSVLASNAVSIFQGQSDEGLRLVLPAPISDPVTGPAFLFLPWWIWAIAIPAIVIPHELCHGIMCRVDKIRIRSVGWLLLTVIPLGAFVEPDEKQLKKAKRSTKLKVYAGGSFINIIIALTISLFLLPFAFTSIFEPVGVSFAANSSSVFGEDVSGFMLSIDGKEIAGRAELLETISDYSPGDTVNVVVTQTYRFIPEEFAASAAMLDETNLTLYTITFGEHPEEAGKAYMGIQALQTFSVRQNGYFELYRLLFWIGLLNLAIGIVNMLPIKPLDGGLFFEEIIGKYFKKNMTKAIMKGLMFILLGLLLFNFAGPFFF